MIKHILLSITLLFVYQFATAQSNKDIVMTVADQPVTVEEFRYIYEKNNGDAADYSKQSINEYLNLYTNFKLKVAKAKDLKMDTIQSLKEELNGYKRQLANSYLMDKEVLQFLVKQLYERTETDQKISHIYVKSDRRSSMADDSKAYDKIKKAKAALDAGRSFGSVANEFSEDKNNAHVDGALGYFTAMMPSGYYELENAMYDTPIGEYSNIAKTSIGYHIVKVTGDRPARGKINVAHILIKSTSPKGEAIAQQLYIDLKDGLGWSNGVDKFSQDNNTKGKDGVLPEIGLNMYDIDFENQAFALENDGDISKPIKTKIGWHILKRISKPERPDFKTFKRIFEPKIKKDERYQRSKDKLIEDIKVAGNYKRENKVYEQFKNSVDDSFLTYKWQISMGYSSEEELMSFGGNAVHSLNEFKEYCRKNTKTRLRYDKTDTTPNSVVDILYDGYVKEKAIDYEQSNLEIKYADFRSLMREYEEGILLFEVTKDAVWDKANKDTVGLKVFYEKGKNKYKTDKKAEIEMIYIMSQDKKQVDKIVKSIKKKGIKKTKSKFNKKSEVVSSLTEVLERTHNQLKGMEFENGASDLSLDEKLGRYVYKRVLNILPATVKPLKDVRGYIVADYQDHLEREWIKSLKKEYEVTQNNEVVKSLTKN
jgi:peptidyl-prolyl cis-trans isomerase SurA